MEPTLEEILIRAQDHEQLDMYPDTSFDDCALCLLIEHVRYPELFSKEEE